MNRTQMIERGRSCSDTFKRLGDRIEREWARIDYDDAVLPQLAAEALVASQPHRSTSGDDITAWVLSSPQLGAQPNADSLFGQPPVTVYAGRRFFIETLHWYDGTTSIHQHSFSGAFSVLEGSSVHTTYSFDVARAFSLRFLVGDLHFRHSEILGQGDTRPITPGAGFIHALFHLQRPSISIVVRNANTADAGTQFAYLRPYVAFDPFDRAVWGRRAEAYLRGLITMEAEHIEDFLTLAFSELDMRWAFHLYEQFSRPELDAELGISGPYAERVRESVEARAADKFGPYLPALSATAKRAHETARLVKLRNRIRGTDERFFLALLLNVPDRARLLSLVAQRFPDADAQERVERSVFALLQDSDKTGVTFEEDALELACGVLAGESLEQATQRLERKHGTLDAEERHAVAAAFAQVCESPLLRPFVAVNTPTLRDCLREKLDGIAIDEMKKTDTVQRASEKVVSPVPDVRS